MLQSVRCIRFGEVLLDENRRAFLLCTNCHTDFTDLQNFRLHLESCTGVEHILQNSAALAFDCEKATQLLGKSLTGIKEYLLYNFNDVHKIEPPPCADDPYRTVKDENFLDLIKIEEELLDPRWYTDLSVEADVGGGSGMMTDKIIGYNELVEAVTPFVQFKENVKTNEDTLRIKKKRELQGGAGKPNSSLKINRIFHSQVDKLEKPATPKTTTMKPQRRLSMHKIPSNVEYTFLDVTEKSIAKPLRKIENKNLEKHKLPKPNGQQVTRAPLSAPAPPTIIIKQSKPIATPKIITQIQKELMREQRDQQPKPEPPKPKPKTYQTRNDKPPEVYTINIKVNSHNQASRQPIPIAPSEPHQPVLSAQKSNNNSNATHACPTTHSIPAAKEKQTEQILNKLQTLGLQVKRTQPPPVAVPQVDAVPTKADKTLELLKKLQSKGMHVKIVSKNPQNSNKSKMQVVSTVMKNSVTSKTTTLASSKPNFTKNVIIKKMK